MTLKRTRSDIQSEHPLKAIFHTMKVVKSIVKSISAKTYDIYLIHPIFLFFCERILKSRMNYFLYIITAFVIVFALSFFASKALKELSNFVTEINRQFYKKV